MRRIWGANMEMKKTPLVGGRKLIMAGLLFLSFILVIPLSHAQTADAGPEITEQEVYDNPSDQELNLNYAIQEIRRGEMLNAAAALERMLYSNPDWHSARLLYSAVLYRLDDSKSALRELSLLKNIELNADQASTYRRYLAEFKTPLPDLTASSDPKPERKSPIRQKYDPFSATVTLGVRADDNAGNFLSDEGFGFENNRGDVSVFAGGRLRFNTPISADKKVVAHASIEGNLRRHETFSETDYDVVSSRIGISVKPSGKGQLSFNIDARQFNISGEKYLEQIGPLVTFQQRISQKSRAQVTVSAYDQNYSPLRNAPLEDERDGFKTRFQFGVTTALKSSQRLSWAVGFDTKDAEIGAFSYDGPRALFSFTQKIKNNAYLRTQFQARKLNYKGSLNPIVDEREETRIFARQAIGVPLNKLVKNKDLKNIDIELGVNYNERFSNIDANDFDNLAADLKLKFNF